MTTRASRAWPLSSDTAGWQELANIALQLESQLVDEAESAAWSETIADLVSRRLPYAEYVDERQQLLKARLRARKLAQTNLRYKYGFKPGDRPRRPGLIRSDIRRFLRAREING
jgi:hypothetical protein